MKRKAFFSIAATALMALNVNAMDHDIAIIPDNHPHLVKTVYSVVPINKHHIDRGAVIAPYKKKDRRTRRQRYGSHKVKS